MTVTVRCAICKEPCDDGYTTEIDGEQRPVHAACYQRETLTDADELIAVAEDMYAHLRYNFLSVTREATPRYTCRICQCVFFDGVHPASPCVMSRAEALLARMDKGVTDG